MRKQAKLGAALVAAAGLLVWSQAYAQTNQSGNTARRHSQRSSKAMSDQQFVQKAAEDGLTEVQLGKIAEQRASDASVKQFAQQMVQGHTQANDKLKSLASQQSITLPSKPGSREQKEVDRLSKLSGSQFDKAYMRWAYRDHRHDIAMFQREANQGQNEAVKNFASNMVPDLQHHLQMAEQTGTQIGALRAGQKTSSNAAHTRTHKSGNQNKQTNQNPY